MSNVSVMNLRRFPIRGVAEILEMNRSTVVFRYSIDETHPETIIMTITRERWKALGHPAYITLAAEDGA